MEPRRASGFVRFMQDPEAPPMFSQASTQYPPIPAHLAYHQPNHHQFPAFCSQPPPAGAATTAAPEEAGTSSRSRTRKRVSATRETTDDQRGRMYYTQEDDLRLVSAWLNNSTDPIEGNARKGETYWSKVAEEYNETTPEGRKRDMSLPKGHWHKTTKKVSAFNGCYVQLRDAYASGRSDGQLMEQALELYRSQEGTQFQYVHWWKAVADSPKWNVHVASGGPGPRKHTPDLNRAAEPMVRPMGIKRVKKGKGTTAEVAVEVKEHLKTLVDAQATQREEMEGFKELQLQLSEQRVEAANLQLKAAKEKKEAKMIEKLSELLQVDTSNMMEWAREAHAKTVTHLMESIWGKGESGPPA